jgi:hypothetical protein
MRYEVILSSTELTENAPAVAVGLPLAAIAVMSLILSLEGIVTVTVPPTARLSNTAVVVWPVNEAPALVMPL